MCVCVFAVDRWFGRRLIDWPSPGHSVCAARSIAASNAMVPRLSDGNTQTDRHTFVAFHDDPYPRADAFVDEFCSRQSCGVQWRWPGANLPSGSS